MSNRFSIIFKYIYIIAAFGFMAYYLSANWTKISFQQQHIDIRLLILTIVLTWISLMGPVVIFRILFKKLAGHLFSFAEIYGIFNLSFIGRYLPGKLWSVVGMVFYAGQYGIGKRIAMTTVLVNEICFKGSGLIWGLVYLAITRKSIELTYISFAAMAFSLIVLHPRIVQVLMDFISRILRKDTMKIDISYGTILSCFAIYLCIWGIYGLSLYFLVIAVSPDSDAAILTVISILPLAWTLGNLAIFVPGGLGVREGLLVAFLAPYLSTEVALLIAILQRIISTALEGINAVISVILKKGR